MKLEIGYNSDFEIRRERPAFAGKTGLRVLYVSDLHFNRYSGKMAERLGRSVCDIAPDILLLGGDYADSKQGLPHLDHFFSRLREIKHVFAVAGNHDYYFGITELKKRAEAHAVRWLEKESAGINIRGMHIRIDGNILTDPDPGDELRILCLHRPLALEDFAAQYQLAFAGHLHGSQFVFYENDSGLFPGRFFYRWNRARAAAGGCSYYISKGLGDTLPLRFNCRKELILVEMPALEKTFSIRPFGGNDSIAALTELLHLAYAKQAESGLRFLASHQDAATTKRRMEEGHCFIIEQDEKLAGTILYYKPGSAGGHPWYEKPGVASFGQFAVHPALQHSGMGAALIRFAESLALRDGAAEMAIDTAETASDLIAYYQKHGYRFAAYAQWKETNYRSVIMSKKLNSPV